MSKPRCVDIKETLDKLKKEKVPSESIKTSPPIESIKTSSRDKIEEYIKLFEKLKSTSEEKESTRTLNKP